MLSSKNTETPKRKPCLGKSFGYTCQTCVVRSYCDGIPETNHIKK